MFTTFFSFSMFCFFKRRWLATQSTPAKSAPGNMNYSSPSSVSFLCTDLFFLLICNLSSVFPRKAWALNQEEVLGDMAKGDKILLRRHSNEEGVVLVLELRALMTKILHGKRKKRYIFYCLFLLSFSLDIKVMEIMS